MSADWLDDELAETDPRPEGRTKFKTKKPLGRRKLATLTTGNGAATDEIIRRLLDLGHITEIVAELKSGKEATAYVARGPHGSVLVKLYREVEARSFKNDAVYREGQVVLDARANRAMGGRSRKGLEMLQNRWVNAEYAHLWTLWRAGLSVPEPLVGPAPFDYTATAPAVLMRLIGTEDEPAPRLSEAALTQGEAWSAWEQSLDGLAGILRLGYVHGDYSTYNLLWWENTVTIIDFPQLTTRKNPHFQDLLRRDVQSLVTSFRKHGVQADPDAVLRDVQRRAQGPAPEPRLLLP